MPQKQVFAVIKMAAKHGIEASRVASRIECIVTRGSLSLFFFSFFFYFAISDEIASGLEQTRFSENPFGHAAPLSAGKSNRANELTDQVSNFNFDETCIYASLALLGSSLRVKRLRSFCNRQNSTREAVSLFKLSSIENNANDDDMYRMGNILEIFCCFENFEKVSPTTLKSFTRMDKDARTIPEMNLVLNEVQGFHLERHLESEDCEKYRFSDIDDREVSIT